MEIVMVDTKYKEYAPIVNSLMNGTISKTTYYGFGITLLKMGIELFLLHKKMTSNLF